MTAPAPVETKAPPIAPWMSKRLRLWNLHAQLLNERTSFISHWQQINKVLFPRRGRFSITDANKGERRNKDIIDATATFAARTLAAGMMSGITSPARSWFRLTTATPALGKVGSVQAWLHEATDILETILLKSNFYDAAHVMYGDLGTYGTSPMLIDEDDEDVIRCYVFPIGSYCLGNDHKGRARVFSREFQMTVRQMVTMFGFENCSTQVQNMWRQGQLEAWWQIVHVIDANEEYDVTRLHSKYLRFMSCYFERGSATMPSPQSLEDKLLRESGYETFPLLVARWDVTGEDVYGTDCPGMTALGDVLQLQFGEKKGMQALEKLVSPPLVAPGQLKNAVISQIPGGVTYDDSPDKMGLRVLHEVRPDLDKLEIKQDKIRGRIERAFYSDLFLMQSYLAEMGGEKPTAREVDVREGEKMLALGPVLERLNKDVLNVGIDRVFRIALKRGLLPEAPEELAGQELKVEYMSIMHAAQKAGGLGQIERFGAFAVQLAMSTQDPSKLDVMDTDEAIRSYGDLSGVAPNLIRSPDAVAALRQDRQKAAQASAQSEQLQAASQTAKNLSQSDTTGKNGLTDILSQIGAGVD